MEARGRHHLAVELPGGPALRWIVKIVRLARIPFVIAIGGRWLGSGLDVLSSSLLAFSVVQLGGSGDTGLPIPDALMAWIRASRSPLTVALMLALGITLCARLVQTLVQWCLTWTHLTVNRKLTPEVMDASLEPSSRRLLDPLYEAVIEATEEAILNSLCMARDMDGVNGNFAMALPVSDVRGLSRR